MEGARSLGDHRDRLPWPAGSSQLPGTSLCVLCWFETVFLSLGGSSWTPISYFLPNCRVASCHTWQGRLVQILALLGDRGKSLDSWPQFPVSFSGDCRNTHLIRLLNERLQAACLEQSPDYRGCSELSAARQPSNSEGPQIAKTVLKKTTKLEDSLPYFKTY